MPTTAAAVPMLDLSWRRKAGQARSAALPASHDLATAPAAARRRLAKEVAGIGHWDWDVETDAITLSREASIMLGLPVGVSIDRLRQAWPEICHPDDIAAVAIFRQQVERGQLPVLAEIRIRRLGGRGHYRRVIVRCRAEPGQGGRVMGELIDVTERRRDQAEAEATHTIFRSVTEAAPGMLYVFDLETAETEHLNHGYLAFLPEGPARGVGATQALLSLIDPDDTPELDRYRRARLTLADGEVAETTLRLILPDGSRRWVNSQCRAIARREDGRVARVVCSVQDVTSIRETAETLRQLSQRLMTMQDDERRRIARDLHDSTAQNLLGAALSLRCVQSQLGSSPALEEALLLLEGSQREIRTLSYLLYPPLLDEMGLPAALSWYVEGFKKRTGSAVKLELPVACPDGGRLPLSREVETALFRVSQEALANAWRHAGATEVVIGLSLGEAPEGGRVVRLRIADDGKGMDRPEGAPPAGLGLAGMAERMLAVGGALTIHSAPGEGTVVEAVGPTEPAIPPTE